MGKKVDNTNRHRCTVTGCNPYLADADAAAEHTEETGHRTAKWPVRSAEGERRARERNKNGYYDKYNVGDKSYAARKGYADGGEPFYDADDDDDVDDPAFAYTKHIEEEYIHPFSDEGVQGVHEWEIR